LLAALIRGNLAGRRAFYGAGGVDTVLHFLQTHTSNARLLRKCVTPQTNYNIQHYIIELFTYFPYGPYIICCRALLK
jgi:hypothetical protein